MTLPIMKIPLTIIALWLCTLSAPAAESVPLQVTEVAPVR